MEKMFQTSNQEKCLLHVYPVVKSYSGPDILSFHPQRGSRAAACDHQGNRPSEVRSCQGPN